MNLIHCKADLDQPALALIRLVFKIILPKFVVSDLSLVEGKGNEVSIFYPF